MLVDAEEVEVRLAVVGMHVVAELVCSICPHIYSYSNKVRSALLGAAQHQQTELHIAKLAWLKTEGPSTLQNLSSPHDFQGWDLHPIICVTCGLESTKGLHLSKGLGENIWGSASLGEENKLSFAEVWAATKQIESTIKPMPLEHPFKPSESGFDCVVCGLDLNESIHKAPPIKPSHYFQVSAISDFCADCGLPQAAH